MRMSSQRALSLFLPQFCCSTTPAAPAFTMAGQLPEPAAAADADTPAPGYYHSPATAGAPPHALSAPAFSLQGKAKRGKSRLQQMLGKLADIGGWFCRTSFAAGGPWASFAKGQM
jgi:hypothetical protein